MKLIIMGPILAVLLLSGVPVFADLVEEPNVPDDPVPIGGSDGTEERDTNQEGGTVDFKNGDKGCDNDHKNCQHVAKHNGNGNTIDGPVAGGVVDTMLKSLPPGCVIQGGPREDFSRLIWEISCPK
jgi:hypothetical protein